MDLYAVRLIADQTPVALCWADSAAEVASYVDAHCGQYGEDYEFAIIVGGAAIFWDNPTAWRMGVKEPLTPEQEDDRETEVAKGLTFFLGASDDWLDLFIGGDLEWLRLPQLT
jgi:hypothetical protein